MVQNHSQPVPALLASIVDSSDDAIVSKDLNGIITSWNQGAERIFGYTAQEAIGQPVLMLIPPDRLDEEPGILKRIRAGVRVDHFETIRQTKDKKLINVSVTISPIRDDTGKVIGASKIARDITEQLTLVNQLRQSQERFRITLSSIGDAVIATDKTGNITFMNPVAEKLTGWTEADAKLLPLSSVFKIVNEFTRKTVESPLDKVLRTKGIVGLANHTILIAKDGMETPIDDSGAPILDPNGEMSGIVVIFRDIVERRAAELATQRLAAIIHGSDDAIIGKNLAGIITSWNEGAERIFGYSGNEIIGKSILLLIPEELHSEENLILSRLQKGERIEHYETTRVTRNGMPVQVSLTVSPIRNAEGVVIGASKIARDITERKRIENSLVRAQIELRRHSEILEDRVADRTKMLQNTVDELETFSYSLSHDLRAPLRAVQSFLQIFMEDYGKQVEPAGLQQLKKVIASSQRMDRMILDLLAFTRLSHEDMPIKSINVEKIIQGLIQERTEFQPSQAKITVKSPLACVMGNEASLTQCLTNLLDNAVKFVPPNVKPDIRVYSEDAGSMTRLWIEDNGIGIKKEDRDQLFRMFERIHGNAYPGTGIGLAIVRKAVERMGGGAGVESEPNKGSRFWLQLPKVSS